MTGQPKERAASLSDGFEIDSCCYPGSVLEEDVSIYQVSLLESTANFLSRLRWIIKNRSGVVKTVSDIFSIVSNK